MRRSDFCTIAPEGHSRHVACEDFDTVRIALERMDGQNRMCECACHDRNKLEARRLLQGGTDERAGE